MAGLIQKDNMERQGDKRNTETVPQHPQLVKRTSSDGDLPPKVGEMARDPQQSPVKGRFRKQRQKAVSCNSFFHNDEATQKFLNDPRVVVENARNLSQEEMNSIYLDILKPLDFFEIFFGRLKREDSEQARAQQEGILI